VDFWNSVVDSFNYYITAGSIIVIVMYSIHYILPGIYYFIKEIRFKISELNKAKSWDIGIKHIYSLTPREFEYWCGEFLSKRGYTDIQNAPKGPDGGKDLICKNGKNTYYVECKRYNPGFGKVNPVSEEIIRKLVGAMHADGIENGIIMTTSELTQSATNYVSTLRPPYKIEIYAAEDLVRSYNDNFTPPSKPLLEKK
jgi:HJR/Mrr/RecB family endonuclease